MSEPQIITLGCRLNSFESEIIRESVKADGLIDAVIVNTCAVTAEAERQARQTIRRIRRQRPTARIIVTGFAAQLNPEKFSAMSEVDKVVGNVEKLDPRHLAANGQRIEVSDISEPLADAPRLIHGFEGRTRAFVQIQQGCSHRCTYCIVPLARGPSRSLAAEHIITQARTLSRAGHSEIILTGADTASYGLDLPDGGSLGGLARLLLERVPEIRRLRLTSLDPGLDDEALFGLLGDEPRLMPHLHLSLQSDDDTILKRMRRRHRSATVADFVRRARKARADVVFGADLIAGFPTESEEMFENSLAAIDRLGLSFLHVFPFSPRPGTPAANMPQVPPAIVSERAARLRRAGDASSAEYLKSRIGSLAEVLVEKNNRGRCRHYAPVRLGFDAPAGTVVSARIVDIRDGELFGISPG